jgi:GT2 family glycosyltransferase
MASASQSDVIIMPVHNRRLVTLHALRRLTEQGVSNWATLLVVDDGSTDGTAEAVAQSFPDVQLLHGNGTWWWGGAMRRGMEWALAHGATRIFWLNDDCHPPPGALAALRDAVATTGAVAWIVAQTASGWSYGGHRRTPFGIRRCTPDEERAGRHETFSGNCVCLPRVWVERVGLPNSTEFPHGFADLDYGLRLHAAGAPLRCLEGYIAENAEPSRPARERWLTSPRSMREIARYFASPRSYLYPPAWWRFARTHWGLCWGPIVFVLPYARWLIIATLRTLAPPLARSLGRRKLK